MDLLIIGDFSGTPFQRLKGIDIPPGYEGIMLTPEEIIKMKNHNSRFISEAFREGLVIRDDYSLFKR